MNPSLPFYYGRFVLLWHELPASTKSDKENSVQSTGNPLRQPAEDADPRSGKRSYMERLGDFPANTPSSACEEDADPPSGEGGYHSHSHWDLMLELDNGQLLTWRLPPLPLAELFQLGHEFVACRLPNHRRDYLDYEGPISNNRGWVKQFASGEYSVVVLDQAADSNGGESEHSTRSLRFKSPMPLPNVLVYTVEFLRIALQGPLDFQCVLLVQSSAEENEVRMKVSG